jgi:hypothetical protein
MHDGKCPKCGEKISLTPQNVEVKPAKGWSIGRYAR